MSDYDPQTDPNFDPDDVTTSFRMDLHIEPRPAQVQILEAFKNSKKIHTLCNAGTGVGKSLIAVEACLYRYRGLIVAPNRPLQWQYMNDPLLKHLFDSGDLAILMGKSNYPCIKRGCYYCTFYKTDECKHGKGCDLFFDEENPDERIYNCADMDYEDQCKVCDHFPTNADTLHECCYYYAARQRAQYARVVIINTAILFYAEFLLQVPYSVIVYDEAHQLEDSYRMLFGKDVLSIRNLYRISKAIGKEMETHKYKDAKVVYVEEYFRVLYPALYDMIQMKRSGSSGKTEFSLTPDKNRKLLTDYHKLLLIVKEQHTEWESLTELDQNIRQIEFLLQDFDSFDIKIEVNKRSVSVVCVPVDVSKIHLLHKDIAEQHLYMSATIFQGYTDRLLGLKPEETDYYSIDNGFKPDKSPIFVASNMSGEHKNRAEFITFSAGCIEKLAPMMTQRCLIHTISRDNQVKLLDQLSPATLSRVIEVRSVKEYLSKLELFKDMPNAILVSYSLKEGIDLKGDLCRYIIILHASLPSSGSAITKYYRDIKGLDVYGYTQATSMAQAAGRGVRSEDDYAKIFLLDNRFMRLNFSKWLPPQWQRAYAQKKFIKF